MKKYAIFVLIILVIILLGSNLIKYKSKSKSESESKNTPNVEIVRQDHSIKNDDDDLLAYVYYDMPVLNGNEDAICKINDFFEDEYSNWLNDIPSNINFYQSNKMKDFLKAVQGWRKNEGDLIGHPFYNTIDTEIIFLNHDIISIRHNSHWMAGGVSSSYQFGYSFDLRTGNILPFTHFSDVEANDFKEVLFNYIVKCDLIDSSDEVKQDFIKQYYAPNSSNDFKSYVDGKTYDLSYQYYYDGNYICLILNDVIYNSSVIMKWNGKTDKKFEASLWNYYLKDNKYYENKIYPISNNTPTD